MLSRLVASAALPLIIITALVGCTPPAPAGPPTSGEELPDETPTPDALSLEPPACLIGDWYIAQDQLQVFYDSVSDATDGAVSFIVEGDTGLSFDGSEFEYTPDLMLDISTPATEGQATLVGSISGGYEADATTVTTSNETVDVDYEYVVGGVAQDASLLFGDALLGSPINGGDYECTPDGPLISFNNGFGRVPVQLVPLP